MSNGTTRETVAVVGGGMMGVSLSLELAKSQRFQVHLFEREDRLGGLSSWIDWGDFPSDRFYHVILPADTATLDFVRELGLEEDVEWARSQTGFYGEGRLVSLSSAVDFMRFPFMSLFQKIRLAMGLVYSSRFLRPAGLDHIKAADWLTSMFGRKTYRVIWEPLLRSKFGPGYDQVPAALMLATIRRLYGARKSAAKSEQMGCLKGGYHPLLIKAAERLVALGAVVHSGRAVRRIDCPAEGRRFDLTLDDGRFSCDRVVLTIPGLEILNIIDPGRALSLKDRLARTEYLGVLCPIFVLKRSLSPYYVINLLEPDLPFTGVIESTRIMDPKYTGGHHLVYLPRYISSTEELWRASDSKILSDFKQGLKKIFPDFQEEDIVDVRVVRDRYALPLGMENLDAGSGGLRRPVPGLHIMNNAQIRQSTLNNDAVIRMARKSAGLIKSEISS